MEEACGTKTSLESVCTLFKLPPDDSVPSDFKIVTSVFVATERLCCCILFLAMLSIIW